MLAGKRFFFKKREHETPIAPDSCLETVGDDTVPEVGKAER